MKRTKATVTISRTIQLQPFTPYKVELSTEIEDENGITWENIKDETDSVSDYVNSSIYELLKMTQNCKQENKV